MESEPRKPGHVMSPFWLQSGGGDHLLSPFLCFQVPSGMDPTCEELKTIKNINDIFDWVGVADIVGPPATNFRAAFLSALGGPSLVRQLVAIPKESYDRALREIKVTVTTPGGQGETATTAERPLTPLEEGQVGTVHRVARITLGLPAEEVGRPAGPGMQAAPASGSAGGGQGSTAGPTSFPEAANQGIRKVKLASVLDQADDTEVIPLGKAMLRDLIETWKATENDDEDPAEDEEASEDQLTGLHFRLGSGATPFVDFGVWRPYGARFGRHLKFHAYIPIPGGGYQQKEFSGPNSFTEWRRSWKPFAFAMTVLGAATRTRVEKYREKIQQLTEDFPTFCWIIALADIRMRSEQMERIRRRCARKHKQLQDAGLPSQYNPSQPWDFVFREAARDEAFWTKHVDKKALMYANQLQSAEEVADEGYGCVREGMSLQVPHRQNPKAARPETAGEEPRSKKRRG